jgi:hypothetical protein
MAQGGARQAVKGDGGPAARPFAEGGFEEKRLCPRVAMDHLLSYTYLDAEQRPAGMGMGKVLDLSGGGIRIRTHSPLAVATRLRMAVAVEEQIFEAQGTIVHQTASGEAHYELGTSFLEVDEAGKALLSQLI